MMKSEGVVNLNLITSFKYHFAKSINFVLLHTSVKMENWGERVWEVAERTEKAREGLPNKGIREPKKKKIFSGRTVSAATECA